MKILCEFQLVFTSFSLAFNFLSQCKVVTFIFLQEPQLSFKDTKRFLKRGQFMRGMKMMAAGALKVGGCRSFSEARQMSLRFLRLESFRALEEASNKLSIKASATPSNFQTPCVFMTL